MAKKLTEKIILQPQMVVRQGLTLDDEWKKLRLEMAAWKIQKEETIKKMDEFYRDKKNEDGGLYASWVYEDIDFQENYFKEKMDELYEREAEENQEKEPR